MVRARGFTLLELLVALTIFAIIGIGSLGALNRVLDQRAAVQVQAERLAALQFLFRRMGQDLGQAIERPVRSPFGEVLPVMESQAGRDLEFTRGGWHNPAARPRSTLQRVGYGLQEDRLLRLDWTVLDRAQDSEPREQVLLEGVESLSLRFLTSQDDWHSEWPPQSLPGSDTAPPLPAAVEVTLKLDGLDELRWLFAVPHREGSPGV